MLYLILLRNSCINAVCLEFDVLQGRKGSVCVAMQRTYEWVIYRISEKSGLLSLCIAHLVLLRNSCINAVCCRAANFIFVWLRRAHMNQSWNVNNTYEWVTNQIKSFRCVLMKVWFVYWSYVEFVTHSHGQLTLFVSFLLSSLIWPSLSHTKSALVERIADKYGILRSLVRTFNLVPGVPGFWWDL